MPLLEVANNIRLNTVIHGNGRTHVVFIHGNLGCASWFDLIPPLLPPHFVVYCIEWKGCGDSDKPPPLPDFSDYTAERHADEMLLAIAALGITKCHIAAHSAGCYIAFHMLLKQPAMFEKVLALDPVGPASLSFDEESLEFFFNARSNKGMARTGLAAAATTLFRDGTIAAGDPQFAPTTTVGQRATFELVLDKAMLANDGVWLGTFINLDRDYRRGGLINRQSKIRQAHLALWGEADTIIPRQTVQRMASEMPNCQSRFCPGVGHSMNIEMPLRYAQIFSEFLSG